MALFGTQRDVSLFRHLSRELMWDIISQQCAFYQLIADQTKVNIYGEAAGSKYYNGPVLLNVLIERGDNASPVDDFGVDFKWEVTYKFLKDDLVEANVYPETGDIIMFQNGYWEIDNVSTAQFFVGKDPEYPYLDAAESNPYEEDLGQFGYDVSVICKAHYTPSDKVNIELSRL